VSSEGHAGSGRMEGGGYYAAHSEAQQAYGELGFEWLEQAAAEVEPPPAPLPFVIADMGAAGGGNSLEPMRRALAARRSPGPALVVHTDIPGNDFSVLFELVAGSPQTYLTGDVYALAEGRSFYERLLPDGVLSLGWSSIAVHWLSRVPEPVPDHIWTTFATGSVRDALREQSARDWRAFLGHRARELRPGGRLIVIGGAARDDGESEAEGLMELALGVLRTLVDDGAIEADELRRMTIPTWDRTSVEFVEPFESGELDDALELRRRAARWLPDPYFEAYSRDGDVDQYAESVAGFFRAAFEQSLWAALDPAGGPERTAAVASRFNASLRERIAAEPERAACRWHVVVLDIARAS